MSTLQGKRDKALLLLGFAGAFRRSELESASSPAICFAPSPDKLRNQTITGKSINAIVQRYAGLAGLDADKFGAHSLRARFITSAAKIASRNASTCIDKINCKFM